MGHLESMSRLIVIPLGQCPKAELVLFQKIDLALADLSRFWKESSILVRFFITGFVEIFVVDEDEAFCLLEKVRKENPDLYSHLRSVTDSVRIYKGEALAVRGDDEREILLGHLINWVDDHS